MTEPACFGTINLSRGSPCGRCPLAGPCAERVSTGRRWGLLLWPRTTVKDHLPEVTSFDEATVADFERPLLAQGMVRAQSAKRVRPGTPVWKYDRRVVVSLVEASPHLVVARFHDVSPTILGTLAGFERVRHIHDTYRRVPVGQDQVGDNRVWCTTVAALSPPPISDLVVQLVCGCLRHGEVA